MLTRQMRKITASLLMLLGLLAQSPWHRAEAEDINLGISSVGLYEVPTEIAARKGFYRDEGLNARKIVIKTGLHASALVAGELDYSTVGGAAMRAAAKGLPLKIVMGWFDRPLHLLVGRPGIKSIKDLKNKKVAISSVGSTPHVMLREALMENGMNPDRDVIIMSIGGSSARLAALQAGSVDAAPLDVAYIEKTEKLGFTNVVYFGDVVNLSLGGLAVSTAKIKSEPDEISKMVRATLKGLRFMKTNKKETMDIVKDYLKISEPYVGRIYDFAIRSINDKGEIAKESLANELRLAREILKIKEEIREEKVVDWSFVRALRKKN